MQKHPQVLINVPLSKTLDLSLPIIQKAITDAENELQQEGRVLLRASGTEPLVRVMVEGINAELVKRLAQGLSETVIECGNI